MNEWEGYELRIFENGLSKICESKKWEDKASIMTISFRICTVWQN
jgi:hypothetical protein